MGHKVHPIGLRLGIVHEWQAKWYAEKGYKDLLQEDLRLRTSIEDRYRDAGIARVDIERQANQVTITLHTSRPGIVIGRGGQRVDESRVLLEAMTGKKVRLNIQEIRQPELDARLVARSIAEQIERRIAYRRAMKQTITRTMQSGAKGIKIICSGRLAGAEIARQATMRQGRVPLHTLRGDIDFGIAEAHTTLGLIGIKVWIYKGEILPGRKVVEAGEAAAAAAPTPLSEAIGEVDSATTKESKVPQDS